MVLKTSNVPCFWKNPMQNGAIDSPSFYYNLRRGRIAVHGLLMLFAEKYEKYFGRSLFIKRKFLSVLLALSLALSLLPTAALAEEAPGGRVGR